VAQVRAKTAFASCLGASIVLLLAIDLYFGPRAFAVQAEPATSASSASSTTPPTTASTVARVEPKPEPTTTSTAAPSASATELAPTGKPKSARFTGVVVRFESERDTNPELGELKKLAAELATDTEPDIILEGHSDSNGNEYYNLSLSLDRANWARDRLVELGVAKTRIRTTGLGSARPLPDSDPRDASNRRVEVRWVKPSEGEGGN